MPRSMNKAVCMMLLLLCVLSPLGGAAPKDDEQDKVRLLEDRIDILEARVKKLLTEGISDDNIVRMQEEIESLKSAGAALTNLLAAYEKENAQLRSDLEGLLKNSGGLSTEEATALRNAFVKMKEEIEQMKAEPVTEAGWAEKVKELQSLVENVKTDQDALKQQMASGASSQAIADMTVTIQKLQDELNETRNQQSVLQAELEALRSGGSPTATHNNGNNNTPPPAGDDIASLIASFGKQGVAEADVVGVIAAKGEAAVPLLIEGLYDRDNRDKVQGCRKTLVAIGGDETAELLLANLDQAAIQKTVIELLGELKNAKAIEPLAKLLDETDQQTTKLTAAGALAQLGSKKGVLVLIEFLKSSDHNRRFLAIHHLTEVAGDTMGFNAYSSEEDRNAAIERWEAWANTKFPD